MRPSNSSGVILITTLWILAILTIFTVGLGYRMGLELKICGYNRDRERALFVAKAGLARAIVELEKDETTCDDLNESWSNNEEVFKDISVGDGSFTVSYPFGDDEVFYGLVDEERKININKASKEDLLGLPEMTEEIASSIIDWRDDDSVGEAEDFYYQSLDLPYYCKDADFEVLEELLLVKGMDPERFSELKEYLTVYGDGSVNINTAPQEVLEALGLSESLAGSIVNFRDSRPFTELGKISEDLGLDPASDEFRLIQRLVNYGLIKLSSDNFRANIVGVVKRAHKDVVAIVGPVDGGGLAVKSWREN